MRISLGELPLMEAGQPLDFDAAAASKYLTEQTSKHGTVEIRVSIGARALARDRRFEFGGTGDCCGRGQIGARSRSRFTTYLVTPTLILLLKPRLGSCDTLLANTTNTIRSAAQATALGRAWRGAATSATTTSRSTLSTPRDLGKSARHLSGSRGVPPLLGHERGTSTAQCQPVPDGGDHAPAAMMLPHMPVMSQGTSRFDCDTTVGAPVTQGANQLCHLCRLCD